MYAVVRTLARQPRLDYSSCHGVASGCPLIIFAPDMKLPFDHPAPFFLLNCPFIPVKIRALADVPPLSNQCLPFVERKLFIAGL
jgi:hypothetical protein